MIQSIVTRAPGSGSSWSLTFVGQFVGYAGLLGVYEESLVTGATLRLDVSSNGQVDNGTGLNVRLTPDGRYAAFTSTATNLTAVTTNGFSQAYLRDTKTGTTQLVSVSTTGIGANSYTDIESISADGRYVLFESLGTNLIPGGTAGSVSLAPGSPGASHGNVYLRDMVAGVTTLITVAPGGAEADAASAGGALSSDGRYVAFSSSAQNLGYTFAKTSSEVFVRDVQLGKTDLVSTDPTGNTATQATSAVAISATGRYVAFSATGLGVVPGAPIASTQTYVKDLQTGALKLASSSSTGDIANAESSQVSISGDGRYVSFLSAATNLVPTDPLAAVPSYTAGLHNVFVKDLTTGNISVATANAAGTLANRDCTSAVIAPDGSAVVFDSAATNLVAGPASASGVYLATIPGSTRVGSALGDPHMTTFDGQAYDFNAVGLYHLVEDNSGAGLDIQVRTGAFADGATYDTAMAMRIDGHVVSLDMLSRDAPCIDGAPQPILATGSEIALGAGSLWFGDNALVFFTREHDKIVADEMTGYLDLHVTLGAMRTAGSVQGLLGNADGIAGNDLGGGGIADFAACWAVSTSQNLLPARPI